MIPKNWRISILNWFAAGRLVLEKDKQPQEYKLSNTYTIGGGGYNGLAGITLGPSTQGPITNQTLTLKITPANGGHIVSVDDALYIIADDGDFDRELGKIITMSKLKS